MEPDGIFAREPLVHAEHRFSPADEDVHHLTDLRPRVAPDDDLDVRVIAEAGVDDRRHPFAEFRDAVVAYGFELGGSENVGRLGVGVREVELEVLSEVELLHVVSVRGCREQDRWTL